MGVHTKKREMETLKTQYMKKSSAIFLAAVTLLIGVFIGNTITSLYMGQQRARTGGGSPQQTQNTNEHAANPAALANLEQAAEADPTNADKWIALGNFCFDHNLSTQAAVAYERALELAPMKVGVWSDLGVMYRRTSRFKEAVDAFAHAASLDPKHVTSRFNMGIVYMHDLNDAPSAIRVWKEVLAINPDAKTPSGERLDAMVAKLER